ncbi:electron transport complex subunit RsxG [Methylotenera versatilis]|uniref:Ion-translocating oxidoreductase complex subunit G n=1 Tax=Methylotenera versatilis (strain 301) TaxID=666681 RepID=D7DM46_METV0|nr:electron transport complex subunit RsxG [Methylotenera versatilis]ADI30740.1 electron transport complex, RnfABCDGE type, G subunit [Methylotenera versatilis 301]
MQETIFKHAIKTAITLVAFAFVGTAMLAYVFDITRAPIEASEKEARLALFKEILPESTYDNDLLKDTVEIAPNEQLGNRQPTLANIAKLNNKTAGVILEAIAHDGYSGDIKLLIAIRADGSISGVRVLAHKETPGLGDYIDIARGNWIKLFNDESVNKTAATQWKVKKDGGKFDYMVGATITPRAVVKAVFKALQFYDANKTTLFAVAKVESKGQ